MKIKKNYAQEAPERDFLYEGLPCLYEDGNYLLFSPYSLSFAIIKQRELFDPTVKRCLKRLNFFGNPFKPRNFSRICKLVFILTNDCNLLCHYCYMFGGEGKRLDMPLEMAIRALNLSVSNHRVDQLRISFFGGEPTMAFDKIQKIVRLAKGLGVNLAFHISTNGITNKKILDYLVQEKFLIGVSMDGPPYLNDLHRPRLDGSSSSGKVESTIKYLAKKGARFLIRATVSSLNVNKMTESLEYWASLGAKYIHFEPVNMSGRASTGYIQPPDADDYINNFKKVLDKAEELNVYIISSPFMNLLTPSVYYCSPSGGETLLFTPDGAISKCYEIQTCNYNHSFFIVGEYDHRTKSFSFDDERCQFLRKFIVQNYTECRECYAKYLCGGGCPLRNYIATGTHFKVDPYSCKIRKELIREAILRLRRSTQTNRISPVLGINAYENFLSWCFNNNTRNKGETKLNIGGEMKKTRNKGNIHRKGNCKELSKDQKKAIALLNKKGVSIMTFPLPDEIKDKKKIFRIKDRCESVF